MTMHIFHWIIVIRNGQVFKNSQKVFKYQHQYLGIYVENFYTWTAGRSASSSFPNAAFPIIVYSDNSLR